MNRCWRVPKPTTSDPTPRRSPSPPHTPRGGGSTDSDQQKAIRITHTSTGNPHTSNRDKQWGSHVPIRTSLHLPDRSVLMVLLYPSEYLPDFITSVRRAPRLSDVFFFLAMVTEVEGGTKGCRGVGKRLGKVIDVGGGKVDNERGAGIHQRRRHFCQSRRPQAKTDCELQLIRWASQLMQFDKHKWHAFC